MRRIWKYEIPIIEDFSIPMPKGAEILAVATQINKPHIWAMVESENPVEDRHFTIAGTGRPFKYPSNNEAKFIGMFFLAEETLVWHVFEVLTKAKNEELEMLQRHIRAKAFFSLGIIAILNDKNILPLTDEKKLHVIDAEIDTDKQTVEIRYEWR